MKVGTIGKTAAEVFNCSMDFVNVMPPGDALALISVTATSGDQDTTAAVISANPAPALAGTKVTFQVQNGQGAERHMISIRVADSSGEKYEADLELQIED